MAAPWLADSTAAIVPRKMLASKELGPAVRCAAWYVWQVYCQGREQSIVINHAGLARDLGSSESSARRWIKDLRSFGLIEIRESSDRDGTTTAYIFNPDDVIGRRGVASSDPQRVLFSEAPAALTPPPEEPPAIAIAAAPRAAVEHRPPEVRGGSGSKTGGGFAPPRAHAGSVLRESKHKSTRSPSVTFGGSTNGEKGIGGSAANIGELVMAVVGGRVRSFEERAAAAEELVAWQLRRVACELLRSSPCLKVAWAIVEGQLPQREVDKVLAALDAAFAGQEPPRDAAGVAMTRSRFYVGRVKNLFRRLGIDWDAAPRRAPA